MGNRLKTSANTKRIFSEIKSSNGLQPFALSKIAIALSIRLDIPLSKDDLMTDSNGLELSRETVCGPYDALYSFLICEFEKKNISEDCLFSTYFKAHIDRGAILLEREFRYDKRIYQHLLKLGHSI